MLESNCVAFTILQALVNQVSLFDKLLRPFYDRYVVVWKLALDFAG